jgi:hypothetical protein
LTKDATALSLGRPSPDSDLLAAVECELETHLLDAATLTHPLGDLGLFVAVGIEQACVEAATGPEHPPLQFMC